MKRGIDYFPFDVDFFEDEKIMFVSSKFGIKGEMVIIRLLTRIYRNGYYLSWDEDTALLFAKTVGLAEGNYCLVNDVVHELARRGFFNQSILCSFGVLTSHGIQERYLKACERRKCIEMVNEYCLVDPQKFNNLRMISLCTQNSDKCIHDVNIPGENVNISRRNALESRVKESRVEHSRGEGKEIKKETESSASGKDMDELQNAVLQLLGGIGSVQHVQLREMAKVFPVSRILEAVKIAKSRNKKSLSYMEGILRSWEKNGYDGDQGHKRNSKNAHSQYAKGIRKDWSDVPESL